MTALHTKKSAAAYLHLSIRTLDELIRRGDIPTVPCPPSRPEQEWGAKLRIRQTDLDAYTAALPQR